MKQRLVEAMLAKAKRGELRFRLSPGYEWDEEGRLVKVPDEQVRSAIELIFARFEQWGTIHRVQSSMAEDGLLVPILSGRRQRLRWGPPDYAHLRRILNHPIYAGAYCHGRCQVEQFLDADQRRQCQGFDSLTRGLDAAARPEIPVVNGASGPLECPPF
jgi:hypothetical protein